MSLRRFSLIEMALLMLVVAIAVYAVFSRVIRYFEVAEKAAVMVTVLEVERGMRIRLALEGGKGAPVRPQRLQDLNPFEYAHALPPNYVGEVGGTSDSGELKSGLWYFDRDRHEIGYVPRLSSRLRGADGEPIRELRFHVKRWSGPAGLPYLAPVAAYVWEPEFGIF